MVQDGKVVTLGYSLKNSKGEVMDRADARDPLVYIHGSGQIVPGLESAISGMKQGEKRAVTVLAADAYGQRNDALRLTVKKEQFPAGAPLNIGMQFQAQGPDGQGVVFTVERIEGDLVQIDGNHPLAGQDLYFEVEILNLRDATEEERSHGHAHGQGGHQH